MKKYIFALTLGTMLASCKPDYTPLQLQGDPFIAFSTTSATVAEGNATPNTSVLTLTRATGDLAGPLTVTFSATGKYKDTGADASNTFTIIGEGGTATTVVIPAGKGSAKVTLTTKNNSVSEKDREIVISLVSASSDLKLGYPGPNSNGKTVNISIKDDDCPFDINKFSGAYNCDEPGYMVYTVNFTSNAVNQITNDNFWDVGAPINYNLDPLTNRVTIPAQTFGSRTAEGTGGVAETCTGRITMPYTVKTTSTGALQDVNTHIFTRK